MNKDFNDFYRKVREAIIKAVRLGGNSNVYIRDNLEIWVTNATKSDVEFGGWNVIYEIECKSFGDLNYNEEEDFSDEDAERYYLDAIADDLENRYLVQMVNKKSVD